MGSTITHAEAMTERRLDVFFSESVKRYPRRPALHVNGRCWSYLELNERCNAVEFALHASGLCGRQVAIGVIHSNCELSYASVVAILRSGNIYVPLNAKLPVSRLLSIVDDAGIVALIIASSEGISEVVCGCLRQSRPLSVLTCCERMAALFESTESGVRQHRLLMIPNRDTPLPREPKLPPVSHTSSDLAYIIYTSGSTGAPKGVAIAHDSAWRCIEKVHRLVRTNEWDRFTQFSALSFDISIAEMFLCWKSAGTLYVPEPHEAMVPLNFAIHNEITVWSSVPSLANVLLRLRILTPGVLSRVRLSMFCGEALPGGLAHAWSIAAPHSRTLNLYGPTEVTMFSTYHEYRVHEEANHRIVPIGVPLTGLSSMIVADGRRVDADDVPGELWLSGDQLAVGYWNNRRATEAAFVRSLGSEPLEEVWYRTGDLVSRDGEVGLLFRGRVDRQVKMLGYRIELEEVETVLRRVSGSVLVAVVPIYGEGGICERIVAYCDKLDTDERSVKDECLQHLPRYKVPARIIQLETFPITSSGKMDYVDLMARSKLLAR